MYEFGHVDVLGLFSVLLTTNMTIYVHSTISVDICAAVRLVSYSISSELKRSFLESPLLSGVRVSAARPREAFSADGLPFLSRAKTMMLLKKMKREEEVGKSKQSSENENEAEQALGSHERKTFFPFVRSACGTCYAYLTLSGET